MNLRTIEFFLTVAEESSITRAAERLHISQPTVSREIIELEKELDKPLFVRTSKNVRLTADGLLFQDTARDMLALYRKALSQKAKDDELRGEICLGAGETESFSCLADKIRDFRRENPKVCFHIISENADEIRTDIDKGVLDLGFVMQSGRLDHYERLEIDRRESWGVLVPDGHPLAGHERVSGKSLLKYPLILPENQTFSLQLVQWLGGEPEVAATYNLIYNVLMLVENGTGLILCLHDPAISRNGLHFIPLHPARTVAPMLIWRKHHALSPAASAFLRAFGYSQDE